MRDRIERAMAYSKSRQAEERRQADEATKNGNEYLAEFYTQRAEFFRGEVNAYVMMLTFVYDEERKVRA